MSALPRLDRSARLSSTNPNVRRLRVEAQTQANPAPDRLNLAHAAVWGVVIGAILAALSYGM